MILDSETAAFMKVAGILAPTLLLRQTGLATVGNDVPLRPEIEKWLHGRMEFIREGLAKVPPHFNRILRKFDPDLRVRWDFYKKHWVVEHLSPIDKLYHVCGTWNKPLDWRLIRHLEQNDTWKTTTDDIVKEGRRKAELAQKSNDSAIADQLYGAIDSMTHRQVEEFIAAEEAIAHGEDIIPMGDDAKFMQRLHDKNLELLKKGIDIPDDPRQAMNPGMKPGVYKRQRRD